MQFDIKNFKSCMGREGQAFLCTLYIDGEKACLVREAGDGGEVMMDWFPGTSASRQQWDEYVAGLPEEPSGYESIPPLKPDNGMALETIISDCEFNKRVKRLCKTKTLFTLKGDKEGEVRIVDAPYSAAIGTTLRNKHGDKLDRIYNE